jgi:hypothetical protein
VDSADGGNSNTERRGRGIDFWTAYSEVIIAVRRLIREA